MNHLAHLFLASREPQKLLGNLAGDFVKGPLGNRFTEEIRAGIVQHRKIDAFTDSHPAAGAFRRVLAAEHGHYARVIADIFFDHFLATDFEHYAREPLEPFLARTFAVLDPQLAQMPGLLRHVYPRMRDERWLISYRDVEGIRSALRNISRRFTRRPQLESAARQLVDARAELQRRFDEFFPEMMAYAAEL